MGIFDLEPNQFSLFIYYLHGGFILIFFNLRSRFHLHAVLRTNLEVPLYSIFFLCNLHMPFTLLVFFFPILSLVRTMDGRNSRIFGGRSRSAAKVLNCIDDENIRYRVYT